MSTVHYSFCPVCNSTAINPLLTVTDHSVSKEQFVIWQCSHCTLRFTQDAPDKETIASYYASTEYISHTNSKEGAINKLYQKVRRHTLERKAGIVMANTSRKGKILDVGAGTGTFLQVMQTKGWEVWGVEPNQSAREKANQTHGLKVDARISLDHMAEKSFDAITLWHVLEHVHDLHENIELFKNLLKPGGRIFIAVPNYTALDSEIYKLFWAAYDVPRHLYHFTPKAMPVLVQQHGLKVVSKKPMWFDSFYISLLSSQYKNGSKSWLGAGLSGLRSNFIALFNQDKCSSIMYIIESVNGQTEFQKAGTNTYR